MWTVIEREFQRLCADAGREGVMAAAPLGRVRLLPEQADYLAGKIERQGWDEGNVTALSLGLAYREEEIKYIPSGWVNSMPAESAWNEYAHAYGELNRALDRVSRALAEGFGGIAEGATLEGLVGQVTHVRDYFPLCVSHRSVAEAAGLGWRGRHGLIVTPEYGPGLRLASVFLPRRIDSPPRELLGCGGCTSCREVCPVLEKGWREDDPDRYREMCRRRIEALGLEDEVCGICVRRCWEIVRDPAFS
jgi:epoxyqueuosine reductase QueG